MDFDFDSANAALNLTGQTLDNGWTVQERHERPPEDGLLRFSVSYTVTHPSGRTGFLKVADFVSVFGQVELLQAATADYIAERNIVILCGEKRLSRVVTAIDHGHFSLPGFLLGDVYYIIFEMASSDVRVALSQAAEIDLLLKIEMFHHVTVGLRQLHQHGIAHQDLKPANLLVFDNEPGRPVGKIADLGRAFREDSPTPHDLDPVPGDRSFAPPEQLYRYVHPEVDVRRYAADLYQLGSLACFMFGAVSTNAILAESLSADHHWNTFGDGYDQALPYLVEAFERALAVLKPQLPPQISTEIIAMVRYLCHPDAARRGHPRSRSRGGSRFALERTVAEIDLLARRTAIAIARAA